MTDLDEYLDESGEDEQDLSAWDDDEAATTTVDWTVETVVSQMRKGRIDLNPSFQRRDAWTKVAKSRYIESLVQRYPVPQIVLAEDQNTPGRYMVIDGKQRLLALRQFCADPSDPRDIEWLPERLKLTGLTETKKLNGITYEEMQEGYPVEAVRFENATIRAVLLRKWHSQDFLYTVFYRLNSGSLRLSPQELRQALFPGKFMDFVDERSGASLALRSLLNKSKPDRRMVDAELLLRFLAFHCGVQSYEGNLKNFLDGTAKTLTQTWVDDSGERVKEAADMLDDAISAAREIFGDDVCRKFSRGRFERPFNRAIFDVQIHFLIDPELRQWQLGHAEDVKAEFQLLCEEEREFVDAVSSTTKTPRAVVARFSAWGRRLEALSGLQAKLPDSVLELIEAA
ncbi:MULTISPECIES: DUF262 domain-containing protein [Streptomyces]|uniref:GmrSD restriction endonucleases N-terminal domain-containing protein n=1 Tax=Streptomyces canarius TaxID=285453 RepID=A0ABQ3CIS7_9ACTN|nr:DUF262 domain-containing protein [Streptomyces canarius]GHA19457.1 hypothetical protein GCM10010345_25100 [Streptomyces canarius]